MFYAPKPKGLKNLAQGFNQVETPGFIHKSESGEYLKASLMVRTETGWKPMLLYVVASPRWVRGDGFTA